MEKLALVNKNGYVFWLCCKEVCDQYLNLENTDMCIDCPNVFYLSAIQPESDEFLLDVEIDRIRQAAFSEGVSKWIFCTSLGSDLYEWSGCSNTGHCCLSLFWSRDKKECIGCDFKGTSVLNHNGFKVGISNSGKLLVTKSK